MWYYITYSTYSIYSEVSSSAIIKDLCFYLVLVASLPHPVDKGRWVQVKRNKVLFKQLCFLSGWCANEKTINVLG